MSSVAYGNRLIEQLVQGGIRDERVLDAIARVPRQSFVDGGLALRAWENTALPIGQGQTISQPYIVARMTELLLERADNGPVLEIGTGSGYQAAILALLVKELCTVERIKALQIQARRRLKQLELHNISFRYGDGWQGWESRGPFAGIMVTAAASDVPTALTEQLADGGRLVIPVGEGYQVLRVIDKTDGQLSSRDVEGVRFVPLVKGDTE